MIGLGHPRAAQDVDRALHAGHIVRAIRHHRESTCAVANKRRIRQLADDLNMHEFLDRRCEKFSTGMKQKTSIARTLVHDPAVMIFDEPTLGLDVMTSRAIVKFVRDCRNRGKTVIYSTHIMSEVEKLCDVVGIIHDGRLMAEGTVAELKTKYAEPDLEEVFVKVIGAEALP